jgi:hypothetical protein
MLTSSSSPYGSEPVVVLGGAIPVDPALSVPLVWTPSAQPWLADGSGGRHLMAAEAGGSALQRTGSQSKILQSPTGEHRICRATEPSASINDV